MAVKVVDASALGALLFGEPGAREVARRLQGHRLVAPHLLPFELASIGRKKAIRHGVDLGSALRALQVFERMAVERIEVALTGLVSMAERTGLTTYDASYLWLAERLEAELITLDRQLETGARKQQEERK